MNTLHEKQFFYYFLVKQLNLVFEELSAIKGEQAHQKRKLDIITEMLERTLRFIDPNSSSFKKVTSLDDLTKHDEVTYTKLVSSFIIIILFIFV